MKGQFEDIKIRFLDPRGEGRGVKGEERGALAKPLTCTPVTLRLECQIFFG